MALDSLLKNILYSTPIGPLIRLVSEDSDGDVPVESLYNKVTGAGPTGADVWNFKQNEIASDNSLARSREYRQTAMQDTIADYQASGVNPAVAFGSGPNSGSSVSAGGVAPSSNGSSLSELLALAKLPMELGLLRSQIKNVDASTENTEERTRTQEQETLLRSITARYLPDMNQAQISNLIASVNKAYSDIEVNNASVDKIHSETEAQDIVNKYLPSYQRSMIDKLKAEKFNIDQDTKYKEYLTLMEKVQSEYARDNGFLMSSNDVLLIGTYLGSLIGVDKSGIEDFFSKSLQPMAKRVSERLAKEYKEVYSAGGSR